MRHAFSFEIPIVRHAEEVSYRHRLLRLVRNVHVTSEYRGLDLCCFEDPIDGFNFVKDADARWRELEFKERQRHHARGLQFVK